MSGDLVDTTEMYLKALYELDEEGVTPMRARLVERLEQSKPTVSETVARLERDGFLELSESRVVLLTTEGRRQATSVMRKHRLAERLLLDVIGLPWEEVHDEACRWEHVMSDAVVARIAALLENTKNDPFGNPIPKANFMGPAEQSALASGLRNISDMVRDSRGEIACVLRRIGEVLQTDQELLGALHGAALVPGARLSIQRSADGVVARVVNGGTVTLSAWAQRHLFVGIV